MNSVIYSPDERVNSIDLDPLPGGDFGDYKDFESFVEGMSQTYSNQWSPETIRYLAIMYGSELSDVLAFAQSDPTLAEPVMEGQPWLLAEAEFSAKHEMVLTLNDFLWRRTRWGYMENLPDRLFSASLSCWAIVKT